ncbi:unnamed protein product [Peronospora destructor]|uniref:Uncharacterized protein n=1 Tax=Peronospora destructor TaxID=86335 RepID=A0AAV0V8R2_9STRA|nr:unnamed protein product [Peronospora destructor]
MATQDATQLWAAVRGLSDKDLDNIQTTITQFFCNSNLYLVSKASLSGQNNFIPLKFGDKVHYVRVDDFLRMLLDFLHQKVQLHTDNRYTSEKPTSLALKLKRKNMATLKSRSMATLDSNMATCDPTDAFDKEVPQLTPCPCSNQDNKTSNHYNFIDIQEYDSQDPSNTSRYCVATIKTI